MLAAAAEARWTLEPLTLIALVAAGAAYAWRTHELGRRAGTGTPKGGAPRAAAFYGGLLALLVALASPLDSLGSERLFSAHMAQHLLLADIAPILLLLGLTSLILRPAVRRLRPLERALGPLSHPAAAVALLVATMWVWHVPALYELALEHPWAHTLEHASFFAAGLAFWWFVIEPVPPRHRLRGGWSIVYVSSAKVLMGLLGLVLTFSPDAIYETYEQAPRTWGLGPVEDLNVGGVLMMVEQSVVLLVFFAILFARMLDAAERDQRRRERLEATR